MSQWHDIVWCCSNAPGPAKLVLLALARHADRHELAEDGFIHNLCMVQLVDMTAMSRSTIRTHLHTLERLGEIEVDRRKGRGKPNRYRILLTPQELHLDLVPLDVRSPEGAELPVLSPETPDYAAGQKRSSSTQQEECP